MSKLYHDFIPEGLNWILFVNVVLISCKAIPLVICIKYV